MRQYTSLEQSKKLLELELDINTADMMYASYHDIVTGKRKYRKWAMELTPMMKLEKNEHPCWSLAALLGLMSNIRLMHFNGLFWCQYCEEAISDFPLYATSEYDNPIDACYELICWLLEHDYIKKN